MKAHTNQFKENISTIGKQLDSKITYELDGVIQTLTSEQLNSITPTYQGAILKSVMKELDLDSNIDIPLGTVLKYQFGLKVNDEYEYLDFGNYVVYSSEKQEDYDSYKIVCYDKLLYSMKQNEDLGITYPTNVRDYIKALCTKIGLEFKNKNDKFANYNKIINQELYVGQEYTYRDIFDELAQVTASTICLNNEDKVEIRYINDLTDLYAITGNNINFESNIEFPITTQIDGKSVQNGTPTPDTPIEIESVSGIENLFDGKMELGSLDNSTGKPITDTKTIRAINYTRVKPNTIYTVNNNINCSIFYNYYDKDFNYLGYNNIQGVPKTFTTTKDTYYIKLRTRQAENITDLNIKIILTEGSISHDYVPYGHWLTVTNTGKNLFDKDNANTIDAPINTNEVGTISTGTYKTIYIKCKPNTTYTISKKYDETKNRLVVAYSYDIPTSGTIIYGRILDNTASSITITTDDNAKYLLAYVWITGQILTIQEILDSIMIEQNTEPTDYKPYQSTSSLVDMNKYDSDENINDYYELSSIGDTKDELNIDKDGNVSINQNIGEVVLDGSETFTSSGGTNYTEFICTVSNLKATNFKPTISNYFSYLINNRVAISSAGSIYIRVPIETNITTVSEFKTWLSTHPVTVKYVLAEPQTVELSKTKALKSFIGKNNIITNDKLIPNMNVTYSKNYETINENFLKDINVNFGEKYGPVNSIVLSRSSESDNVYLRDEKSIVKNGLCEIKIKDNQIMNWNDRSDYLPDILEKLNGLEYYINDFSSTGIAYLDLCDRYDIEIFDNTYSCIMLNDELLVTQGLEENVHTDMPEETETDYKKADKTDRKINKAYIIVDKQQQEITSLTQTTETIQDNLQQNYYDRTQTNELIQTSSTGITNTFSEAGGNNVFRNTGLWFSDQEENTWEYWTGIAKKTTNDKAVLGTSILLQSGTFSQEQEVPNGNYSISFYYKLSNPLATATVTINENTYELTSTDYKQFYTGEQDENKQYITFPIEVTANHLNISFTTDIDNSVEVYDLMANKGSVKLAYSQNENEITTDTVNISKGITITSSVNDTKFKANADGIRIVDKNSDENITEFTDKGMTTKEAVVKDEATIVQVLIQNIGDQTWFTRL